MGDSREVNFWRVSVGEVWFWIIIGRRARGYRQGRERTVGGWLRKSCRGVRERVIGVKCSGL